MCAGAGSENNCRSPIANCQFEERQSGAAWHFQSAIGNRKSAMNDIVTYWQDAARAQPVQAGIVPISNAQNRRMVEQRFGKNIRASRFDLQFTTDENKQLWALSDIMSVDAQANFLIRRTLRMRCRYVFHNNPFAIGAAKRLANFVIGTGPILHLGTANKANNVAVETSFNLWAKRVRLGRKLRTSRNCRFYNGEGFLLLRTNPKIRHPVKLDLFEVEADQVSSPLYGIFPSNYPDQWFDGVILDPWGNKEVFHVLRQHPGAFGAFLVMGYEFDSWPARYVLHDYDHQRPFQQRGIPELTPAADLFEEARRYRKSVLAASEEASNKSGFIKSQEAPGSGGTDEPDTGWGDGMDYVQSRRREWGVLPRGYDAFQIKAEQPVNTYDKYLMSLMVEASQVIDMPLFILTGDARLANMSSAYVATQGFDKRVQSDRSEYEELLDQALEEWLLEARRIPSVIPDDFPDDPPHSWRWPRNLSHADPQKMAVAENQRLKNGRSPSAEAADRGEDWDEICDRAASDYGVSVEEYKATVFQSVFAERGKPPPASVTPDTGDTPESPEDIEDDEGQEE
jgi:capsid protein